MTVRRADMARSGHGDGHDRAWGTAGLIAETHGLGSSTRIGAPPHDLGPPRPPKATDAPRRRDRRDLRRAGAARRGGGRGVHPGALPRGPPAFDAGSAP